MIMLNSDEYKSKNKKCR